MLFGVKSKKLADELGQLELQIEDLETNEAVNRPHGRSSAMKPGREPLRSHFPSSIITLPASVLVNNM